MIPEDQSLTVRRVVLGAELDEARQVVGLDHRGGAGVVHQRDQLAGLNLVDLVDGVGDALGLPLLAAAGVDDDVHVFADGCVRHLGQVVGGHAGLGFQVGAAKIDHDGKDVLAAAEDVRVLCAGAGGNGLVQRADVRLAVPAGGDRAAAGEAAQKAGDVQTGGCGGAAGAAQQTADAGEDAAAGAAAEQAAEEAALLAAAGGPAGGTEQAAEDAASAAKEQRGDQDDDDQLAAAQTACGAALRLRAVLILLIAAGVAGRPRVFRAAGVTDVLAGGLAAADALAALMDAACAAGDVFAPALEAIVHAITLL